MTLDPLARLVAINDIEQLKARYCRYCDQQDWAGYRSLFLDDAVTEYSDATFDDPDVMVDYFAELLDGGSSVHHTHNAEITFSSADDAQGIWTLFDRVVLAPGRRSPGWNGYARYWETYRRVDGRWYIATLRVERFHRLPLEEGLT